MRLFSVLMFCFLVSSCSSLTDSEIDKSVLTSKLRQMSQVSNENKKTASYYNDFFTAYALSVGGTVEIVKTNAGNVYYIKVPSNVAAIKSVMPKSAIPLFDIEDEENKPGEIFIAKDNENFVQSCNGSIVGDVWLDRLIHQGVVNPLFYIDKDKLEMMKKNPGGWGGSDGAPIITEGGLNIFNKNHVEEMSQPNSPQIRLKGSSSSCYEDGKGAGYKYSVYVGEGYSTKSMSGDLIFIYVPKETHENAIKLSLEEGYLKAEKRVARSEKSNERRREYAERAAKEKAKIDSLNQLNKMAWENRINQTYINGDMVCTYDNLLGYVEDYNDKNIKIQLVGRALGEPGYFFGNMREIEFKSESVQNTIWLSRPEVASCSFKQNL